MFRKERGTAMQRICTRAHSRAQKRPSWLVRLRYSGWIVVRPPAIKFLSRMIPYVSRACPSVVQRVRLGSLPSQPRDWRSRSIRKIFGSLAVLSSIGS